MCSPGARDNSNPPRQRNLNVLKIRYFYDAFLSFWCEFEEIETKWKNNLHQTGIQHQSPAETCFYAGPLTLSVRWAQTLSTTGVHTVGGKPGVTAYLLLQGHDRVHPEVAALAGVRDAHRAGEEEPGGQHLEAAPEETGRLSVMDLNYNVVRGGSALQTSSLHKFPFYWVAILN